MTAYDANGELNFSFDGVADPGDPDWRWRTVRGGDLPCDVTVRFAVDEKQGRLMCTGLRIGAEEGEEEFEIGSRTLRDIHLGNVLRYVREHISGAWGQSYFDGPQPKMNDQQKELMRSLGSPRKPSNAWTR